MATTTFQEIVKRLDELANLYNKTKEEKYKNEWYNLLKKIPKICY